MKNTDMSQACQHALLSRSPVGQVSVCPDCGVVHLSLDCLSVRLEEKAFQALAVMVMQAQQRLQAVVLRDKLPAERQPAMVH
ncbi:hypothetical protein C6P64_07425 [Malikia granosa]|uniref:Uncharacterized protein n=2 Tax=Malikia granosa TaxID=263067 RepID=A0A2S9K633_9BURK|nr:hypothetical protein C6P64_07425 [Malikia granosa]